MNIVDSSLWIEYFLDNDIDASVINAVLDVTLKDFGFCRA
jgi:hypothetical protein